MVLWQTHIPEISQVFMVCQSFTAKFIKEVYKKTTVLKAG